MMYRENNSSIEKAALSASRPLHILHWAIQHLKQGTLSLDDSMDLKIRSTYLF